MKIDIVSDTICPWCFIGKRRLEQALDLKPHGGLDISWRPFQLNPGMPGHGMDRQKYLGTKFGSEERAERAYATIRDAGRELGIGFRFDLIERTPNTVNSHRLIHRAATLGRPDAQGALVEALFDAYFTQGRDIGDNGTLANIAAAAGFGRADMLAWLDGAEDTEQILSADERIRAQGVSGVPCFIIEDKFAVAGAQSPEVFHQIFDLVREAAAIETVPAASAAE